MSGIETVAAETFIYGALAADAQLAAIVGQRIYAYVAPPGAAMPCVVFHLQAAGSDLTVVGAARVWSNLLYAVKAIDETTTFAGSLKSAAERIDAALHAASGTNVNGSVLACVRERPLTLVEQYNDRFFRHLGGQYRLFVQ